MDAPFVSSFVCANCGAPGDSIPGGAKLKSCSVCKVVKYCRRECQVEAIFYKRQMLESNVNI
jgi:radical SAM protein with 4Fe4S-binding SPASM domain